MITATYDLPCPVVTGRALPIPDVTALHTPPHDRHGGGVVVWCCHPSHYTITPYSCWALPHLIYRSSGPGVAFSYDYLPRRFHSGVTFWRFCWLPLPPVHDCLYSVITHLRFRVLPAGDYYPLITGAPHDCVYIRDYHVDLITGRDLLNVITDVTLPVLPCTPHPAPTLLYGVR